MLQAIEIGRRSNDVWLLQDVSAIIQPGERWAVVGPTGSGKTLLLRCLALLDPVDAGEVRWHGKPVRRDAVPLFRSQVIYLHQRPALFDGTVEQNLCEAYSLKVHHGRRYDRERIATQLKSLGQPESFLSKAQQHLSGGEQQLTALLRAIQLDPQVLLLDEPTSALDANSTAMVEQLVDDWFAERPAERALVWVTHDEAQAGRVAGGHWRMNSGRML